MSSKQGWRYGHVAIRCIAVCCCVAGCSGFMEQYQGSSLGGHISEKYALTRLEGKVCVLRGQVPAWKIGYQNMISDSLTDLLGGYARKAEHDLEILSYSDFLNEVNERGLVEEYFRMTEFYEQGGIFPKQSLNFFRDEMGVDYFIKPALLDLQQKDDTRWSFFSLRVVKTKETSVTVSAEIWDTTRGWKVWGGSREATIAGERMTERRIPADKAAYLAWEDLFEDLLK